MNFNPFAENKNPSVSMFAKEQKKIQATAEAVEDLEAKYGINEYLGAEMNNETFAFFKQLVDQIGEEGVTFLLNRSETTFRDRELTALDCSYAQITSLPKLPSGITRLDCNMNHIFTLPELPAGLVYLDCGDNLITSLPELPAGLKILLFYLTPITSLPELPSTLEKLNGNSSRISTLPEIPAGLKQLWLNETPLAKDRGFMDKLIEDHPNVDINY